MNKCQIRLMVVLIVFSFFILINSIVIAENDKSIYREGINYLRKGEAEAALLKFYRVVADFPKSEYAEKAQFNIIEYFYGDNQGGQSEKEIDNYFKLFPQGKSMQAVKEMSDKSTLRILKNNIEELIQNKDWKSCIKNSKIILIQKPDDFEAEDKLTKCEEENKIQMAIENQNETKKSKEFIIDETAKTLGISNAKLLEDYENFWKNEE